MWFEIYLDAQNLWRWRLCKRELDNQICIIATSHQGHRYKVVCEREIFNVKMTNSVTPVIRV